MIGWANPGALAALILVAGPIVVHLLLRHRARRVPFPSLRFLRASQTAAARLRWPSDALLLLLRIAIVGVAVASLAQPLLVTNRRIVHWNSRLAKAVVVDSSPSMAPLSVEVAAVANAEAGSPALTTRIDAADLRLGVARAAARLEAMPPARREIVVISDFQQGALRSADFDSIPPEIGIRLVPVGAATTSRAVPGFSVLTSTGSARQDILLTADATRVDAVVPQARAEGLDLLARSSDAAAVQHLRRAIVAAGTPAPSPREPLTVAFAGATLPATRALPSGWMLDTVLRLTRDQELRQACAETKPGTAEGVDDRWVAVCEAADRRPIVRAAALDHRLIVAVAADPTTFVAAAVVRGLLRARQGTPARPEEEVRRLSSAELAPLMRPPVPIAGVPPASGYLSDARWGWGMVLLLLAIEGFVRRARPDLAATEPRRDAA